MSNSWYQSLRITNGHIIINTIDEIKSIFHSKLRQLEIGWKTKIKFNVVSTKNFCFCSKLKQLVVYGYQVINLINDFDHFGITKNLNSLVIIIEGSLQLTVTLSRSNEKILKHVFFNNLNKHPLLTTIAMGY